MVGDYPVVTLCGSTRFKNEFMEVQKRLTLEGNIVISVGLFGHSGDQEVWENMDEGTLTKTKEMLDDMHKRKIDMADSIYVINVGGYIGESTKSEIEYAKANGKKIEYLEPIISDMLKKKIDAFYDTYSPYTSLEEREYTKYNVEQILKDLEVSPNDNADCLDMIKDIIWLYEHV